MGGSGAPEIHSRRPRSPLGRNWGISFWETRIWERLNREVEPLTAYPRRSCLHLNFRAVLAILTAVFGGFALSRLQVSCNQTPRKYPPFGGFLRFSHSPDRLHAIYVFSWLSRLPKM